MRGLSDASMGHARTSLFMAPLIGCTFHLWTGRVSDKPLWLQSLYGRPHFLRMFRAATGTTSHQCLLDLKLEKVREFLATRKTPPIEIGAACGFSGHAHLATAFRERFGATPSR
jgi:methylphosphotriester-DNA--protein-cysteine methyltransferase